MDANWLAAWSSFGQAIGTVGAFATGGWLLHREMRRDRRMDDDRRREQASRVYAWIAFDRDVMFPEQRVRNPRTWSELEGFPTEFEPVTREGLQQGDKVAPVFVTCIENRSDGPIYAVRSPIGHMVEFNSLHRLLMKPGDTFRVYWLDPKIRPSDVEKVVGPTEVVFNDAASRTWRRTGLGELVEL